ncbi:hypothetical protein [Acetobacter thailandicus]|uniref:hypothetical protein n=1 Tax=Acetobacter thailandicus TaxID=1502842 RepID=UPI001BAABF8D|nr:hypothetical protein [Acetobacter thailandicus]MBS1002281.1 hypothetical protein [Acetobacter thailandicus]
MSIRKKIKEFDYFIKNILLDDQIGTKPNENRVLVIGYSVPLGMGIISTISPLYLRFINYHKEFSIFFAIIASAIFVGYIQITARRGIQNKNKEKRILLLKKTRKLLNYSYFFSISGILISVLSFKFPPQNATDENFFIPMILLIVFAVMGVLAIPFTFMARRISWLVNPR